MKFRTLLHALLFGVLTAIVGIAIIYGVQCLYGDPEPLFIDTYTCTLTDASEQVYDGDTIKDVRVLLLKHPFGKWEYGEYWPGVHITERGVEIQTDIRIAGIDTPEKRVSTKNADGSKRSEASRAREKAAALASRQALIDLLKANDNKFSISDPMDGKYAGRTVVDVAVNEMDVATLLIQKGHAKPYDGGTKPDWGWGQ
ncbi:MAG: thermonuclease family protein [Candidatus Poribacteria bacterium]|nr:thermonuclease family protein [Candidatus Poribacteria bacterium]